MVEAAHKLVPEHILASVHTDPALQIRAWLAQATVVRALLERVRPTLAIERSFKTKKHSVCRTRNLLR